VADAYETLLSRASAEDVRDEISKLIEDFAEGKVRDKARMALLGKIVPKALREGLYAATPEQKAQASKMALDVFLQKHAVQRAAKTAETEAAFKRSQEAADAAFRRTQAAADANLTRADLTAEADAKRKVQVAAELHKIKNPPTGPGPTAQEIGKQRVALIDEQIRLGEFSPKTILDNDLELIEKALPDGAFVKQRLVGDLTVAKMNIEGKVLGDLREHLGGTEPLPGTADAVKTRTRLALEQTGRKPPDILEVGKRTQAAEISLNQVLENPKIAASAGSKPFLEKASASIALGKAAEAEGAIARAAEAVNMGGIKGLLSKHPGGALAAILLPLLLFSRGKSTAEEGASVPQQLQLLQALNEQQRQQALVESLVNSRAAAADRNQAQTELLRMKMLGNVGGVPML